MQLFYTYLENRILSVNTRNGEIMKIVFLEANTLGDDVDLSMFDKLGEVVKYPLSDLAKNAERCKDADVVVLNKIHVGADLLDGNDKTKLICITATGTNIVDFEYTNARGITVTNVKGYSTESVVQHTFALAFYLWEKMSYYDNFVKSGAYAASDVFSHFTEKFHELAGHTWGIIGLGNIGRRVAEVAKAFGCKVIYYSTSGTHDEPGYERVSLEKLLEESDIISVHAPLNAATKGLVGSGELKLMKKSAIILNLGRGGIIDEEALISALEQGTIAGAGTDVLTKEPMLPDSPYMRVKDSGKLIVTPHIAWATIEARKRCADEILMNMEAWLNGKERNVCTK